METLEKHSISNADDNEEIYDAENNLVKIKDTSLFDIG